MTNRAADGECSEVGVARAGPWLEPQPSMPSEQPLQKRVQFGARLVRGMDPGDRNRVREAGAVLQQMPNGDRCCPSAWPQQPRGGNKRSDGHVKFQHSSLDEAQRRGRRSDLGHREPRKGGVDSHWLSRDRVRKPGRAPATDALGPHNDHDDPRRRGPNRVANGLLEVHIGHQPLQSAKVEQPRNDLTADRAERASERELSVRHDAYRAANAVAEPPRFRRRSTAVHVRLDFDSTPAGGWRPPLALGGGSPW